MLDTSGRIGKLRLKNRLVMPPLVTNLGDEEGYVTEESMAYYTKRGKGGFGLIITEATAICPRGKGFPCELGLWREEQIPGYRRLIEALHREGSKVFVQLHHTGRQTKRDTIRGQRPEAPSEIPCPVMKEMPEAMTEERIWDVIEAFGDSALRAKQAGADGVEIHGAHGYLVAQFMSGYANKRRDAFGGSFENRMGFPLEIVKNIRKKVGPDFPIGFRISYDEKVLGGRVLEETIEAVKLLEKSGVDVIHVTMGVYESSYYISADNKLPRGYMRYQTKKIKEAVSIPVISVGRYGQEEANEALEKGYADFIAFGRPTIADPELARKMLEGRPEDIETCGYCNYCLNQIFSGKKVECVKNIGKNR